MRKNLISIIITYLSPDKKALPLTVMYSGYICGLFSAAFHFFRQSYIYGEILLMFVLLRLLSLPPILHVRRDSLDVYSLPPSVSSANPACTAKFSLGLLCFAQHLIKIIIPRGNLPPSPVCITWKVKNH